MTRNDAFYKILFAIEIALLPMVIFAYLFLEPWTVGVFVAGVLVAKIWLELFNNKTFSHVLIKSIGNVLVFAVLLILFMAIGAINIALGVFALIFVILANIFKLALYSRQINDTIEAVDYCYVIFECLAILAFTFTMFYNLVTNIALFAILLTAVVSVSYKVFYTFKYTNFVLTLKNLFKRK